MVQATLEKIIAAEMKRSEPSPKEEERVAKIKKYSMQRVQNACKGRKIKLTPLLAGSFAKGTWVAGDADIDIFVKVPPNLTKDELGKLGIEIGKQALRGHSPYLRYSEHPYVEALVKGIKVNVVACYDVPKGEWKSAADRSPYHTELIKQKFDTKMKSETRLLKRFLKGLGIYGAEIKTRGFSGYVAEVLILKFGSLLEVLRNISKTKFGDSIVPTESEKVYTRLHNTPLIILDPVDPRRNLGAAISKQRVAEFIFGAGLFLERPNASFFSAKYAPPLKRQTLGNVVVVAFKHQERTVDKLWGQLNKSLYHLETHLIEKDFHVLRSISSSDDKKESAFVFLLEDTHLSERRDRAGPETTFSGDSIKFVAANKKRSELLWIGSDGKVHSLIKRDFCNITDTLEFILGSSITSSGISAGLREEVRATKRIIVGKRILQFIPSRGWLKEAVAEIASTSRIITGSD